MMSIGPGGIGGFQIAGSIAGTQANQANSDRLKAEQAARDAKIEQQQFAAGEQQEQQDADVSADRDPDGRMPYSAPDHSDGHPAGDQAPESKALADDPDEELGKTL